MALNLKENREGGTHKRKRVHLEGSPGKLMILVWVM
jgi:hypothetical protein